MSNLATAYGESGGLVLQQATSDDHLIEMWLAKSESEKTRKAYASAIKRLRLWLDLQGVSSLRMVTAGLLMAYQETFKASWSDATKNLNKAAIKSLWTYGCELQYLPFNIPHAVYTLKKPRPVTAERILTEGEMQKAIKLETYPRAQLFLRLLYGTGVRVTEALALQWQDFYVRRGRVYVSVQHGKGDEFREIGCPANLYKDLIAARPFNAVDSDPIFPEAYITAYRWVKRAMKRIKKPEGSPHWARHAHAVVSHENGADWHSIARQLGHKKASFTMDRYGHFTGDHSSDFIKC